MNERATQLSSEQRLWLDSVCDGPRREAPPEPPHTLVERHAQAAPDAVALRHRDRSLTYGELNRRANRLARYLMAKGIGAESKVVVCVEPGFDILIALLAILKAGAAYVPLDPTYPAAHQRTLVSDTQPKLVITDRRPSDDFPFGAFPRLSLDDSEHLLAAFSEANPTLTVPQSATAYVYYTSGTTGKPKGIVASYANLASYIAAARERYQFNERDVVPAIARFAFSISMFELLSPLSAGGTLVMLDREHVLNPTRMAETLREVTLFHMGPSLLRPVIEHIKSHYGDFSQFAGVRHASSGGDMIPPDVLESAKTVFPNADVFVIYGCSEIACMGCTYQVPRDRVITKTYVGRPFDDMSVRILGDTLERLPVGEVGEICFSGSGVVKGYLNRPDQTAAKFVKLDGRRFYRTGDMGRITTEGWLEILGRVDFQAKVRGMRIELGEVEHHLRRAPNVKECVVMARDGTDGEKVLVAYIVPRDTKVARDSDTREVNPAAAIRRHMVEQLPDYMVPAIYLEIPKLPLNHNMKVDRRALPSPLEREARSDRKSRAPETATERQLATLWERLLRVEEIGLDDNFFELGGYSLLAASFLVEAKKELGVELDGMDVLRESLEVLGRICDERLGRSLSAPVRPARAPARARVELFHFGEGNSLYGVLHHPEEPRVNEAVLVCGPVGQEKARAHFVLKNLAKRLAAAGVAVLEFDYYACGDSLGDDIDATSTRWERDIADALEELRRRTGVARVTAVGVRVGAPLLWSVAHRLGFARLVFWDPVCNGSKHVLAMAEMQRKYLRAAEHLTRRRRKARGVELLGTTFSERALLELRALTMEPAFPRHGVPIKWLATSSAADQTATYQRIAQAETGSRLATLDASCGWYDLGRLEDVLPDVGIASVLSTMATEAT
jgi:amino acid adenylation domain-containing protein